MRSRRDLLDKLLYTRRFFRHPIDSMFDLRYGDRGSALSATLLLIAVYLVNVLSLAVTNFQFNLLGLSGVGPVQLALVVFVPFGVWVVANYLVSSIARGQGRFVDVYISAAYALTPIIYFSPIIAVVSHAFTREELVIYGTLNTVTVGWTAFLFFLHVMVVHQYDVGETVRVILWTVFTMAMMALFGVTLAMITVQSANFIVEVFLEATLSI